MGAKPAPPQTVRTRFARASDRAGTACSHTRGRTP